KAGGGRLTRDALASSGADICDGAHDGTRHQRHSSRGRRRRARAPRAGADGCGDPRPACPRAHPDVLATLEAAIMQEPVPVSRGEVADAVDAAFALVARI